jgi:ketosteroid isomerase-like protein
LVSVERQTQIAVDFVTNIACGGIAEQFYADDLTAWSPLMGLITREEYLPKLDVVKRVWSEPLAVTIDTVTAQPGRVALQARSRGVLYDGQAYANEYLFLIEFNEQGQIRHVREYFDKDPVRDILQPAVNDWRTHHRL